MAEGGFCEIDPLMKHTDDRDGDGDTRMPFQPNGASTPAPGGQEIPM